MAAPRPMTAEELAATYAAIGVAPEDARDAIESEIDEGFAQLAFAVFAMEVWRLVDSWRDPAWVRRLLDGTARAKEPAVLDAVRKAVDLGMTPEELGEIARYVAAAQAFYTLMVLDDGGPLRLQEERGVDLPGWQVTELAPDGTPTGRELDALHETFFGWESGLAAGDED